MTQTPIFWEEKRLWDLIREIDSLEQISELGGDLSVEDVKVLEQLRTGEITDDQASELVERLTQTILQRMRTPES